MKKIFLIMGAFVVISTNSFAQLAKGTFMPGIGFGYNYNSVRNHDPINGGGYSNDNTYKTSNLLGNINLGYFITDKIVLGVFGGYSQSNNDNTEFQNLNNNINYLSSSTSNSILSGVFIRSYKMFKNNKFGFFGQFSSSYSFGKSSRHYSQTNNSGFTNYSETRGTSGMFRASISPGIVYFISNKVGIEAMFGNVGFNSGTYDSFNQYTQVGSGTVNNFYTNFSLSSLQLGVNFYFGKKVVDPK